MQNFSTPLPVQQLSNHGGVKCTPLDQVFAVGAESLFKSNDNVTAIPAGGTFQLQIPLTTVG